MVVISNSFPRIKTCYSPNWGVKNCCALFFKVCSPVCWSAALVKKTAPKLSFITTPPSLHLLHVFPVFFFTLWFVSTSSPQLTLSSSHQTLVATYSFSLLRIKKELFYFTNEFPPIKVNRTSRSNVWFKTSHSWTIHKKIHSLGFQKTRKSFYNFDRFACRRQTEWHL